MKERDAPLRKHFLYELQLNVSKLQISTKFQCAFYLSATCGKNDVVQGDELARADNGTVHFQKPLVLQVRVVQDSQRKEFDPQKVVIGFMQINLSVHIRSDNRPDQLLVAGHVKIDLTTELEKLKLTTEEGASSYIRTYSLQKCPDRKSSLELGMKLTRINNNVDPTFQTLMKTLKYRDESGSSDSSYRSNPELREYFFGRDQLSRAGSPVQQVKVCKSFFKKKLSIDDEGSPKHAEGRFTLPSSPNSKFEHAVMYFRKSLHEQFGEGVDQISELPIKTDSMEVVKLSTSESGIVTPPICEKCLAREHQIADSNRLYRQKESELRQLLNETEQELRAYIWKVEERVFDLEALLTDREQDCKEARQRLDQVIFRHSIDLGEKDKAIKQLERCIDELSQKPLKQPQPCQQILKQRVLNKEQVIRPQKGRNQGFLPGFLQQVSKSLDPAFQFNDKISSLESSSLLLIERNKELLETLTLTRTQMNHLTDSLKQLGSELHEPSQRRLFEVLQQFIPAESHQ